MQPNTRAQIQREREPVCEYLGNKYGDTFTRAIQNNLVIDDVPCMYVFPTLCVRCSLHTDLICEFTKRYVNTTNGEKYGISSLMKKTANETINQIAYN